MSSIFYYVLVALTSLAVTPFMTAVISRYSKDEMFSFKDLNKEVKFDWKVSIITPAIIVALFYHYGICIEFFLFSILTIILVMEAFIDIKAKILPNLLNFIGFIIGLTYAYFMCLSDIVAGLNLFGGMILGAGIFLIISVFALIIYKKEGMGLGDVKLMGMLGLFFGMTNIIQIFVLSFFVGAIISIILLITKIKKASDYIAFGPFIVMAAVFTMFVPASVSMTYINTLLIK